MRVHGTCIHRVEANLGDLVEVIVWWYGRIVYAGGWRDQTARIVVDRNRAEPEVRLARVVSVGIDSAAAWKHLDFMSEGFKHNLARWPGFAVRYAPVG